MDKDILLPAAILVCWSLIMLLWLAASRFPAMAKIKKQLNVAKPGGRGQDLEGLIPDQVNWKSHNYSHLMEQPTIFYAIILIAAVAGGVTPIMVNLAWGYVIFRIIHSLYQSLINNVMVRFAIFMMATICLFILSIMTVNILI
ncbi:hypothetical protein LPB140_07370 [Sphingorhabdus lutea]|uniref:MAPEG family protein n=1 Tax=Sphingorhabdus lutea TaxID=1913578 RepID=A0A1L3JBW9_9SPHN|nr:MAPEG family protein [Sphingorhabdus lutea]APG62637.1 hypothetical protein LPB140_07370 [Sphingorhabdus lutea]